MVSVVQLVVKQNVNMVRVKDLECSDAR